jgi:hypothetical protein
MRLSGENIYCDRKIIKESASASRYCRQQFPVATTLSWLGTAGGYNPPYGPGSIIPELRGEGLPTV